MSHDKIADALGISNEIESGLAEKQINITKTETGNDENDDYIISRSALRSLLENGANSVSEILSIAKSSQKARDYEVAAGFIKNLADLTKNLKDLHKKDALVQKVSNLDSEAGNQLNGDRPVFIGTTTQLLQELKKAREEIK